MKPLPLRSHSFKLLLLSLMHFVTDGLCSFLVFSKLYPNNPSQAVIIFFAYNILAFVTQSPVGIIIDKYNKPKMFLAIREKHPEMPIILMSRPSCNVKERVAIMMRTYENALARGDRNVYVIGGAGLNKKGGTVDGCHPNDLGFYYMAKDLESTLKKCLEDCVK